MARRFRPLGASSPVRGNSSDEQESAESFAHCRAASTISPIFSSSTNVSEGRAQVLAMSSGDETVTIEEAGHPQPTRPAQSPIQMRYEEFIPASEGQVGQSRYVNINTAPVVLDPYNVDELSEDGGGWDAAPSLEGAAAIFDFPEPPVHKEEPYQCGPRYVVPADYGVGSEITHRLNMAVETNPATTLTEEMDFYNARSDYGRSFNWNDTPNEWDMSVSTMSGRVELDDIIRMEMNAALERHAKCHVETNTDVGGLPVEKKWIPLEPKIELIEEDKEMSTALFESAYLMRSVGEDVEPVMLDKGTQLTVLLNVHDYRPPLEDRFDRRYTNRFNEFLEDYRRRVDPDFNPFERPEPPVNANLVGLNTSESFRRSRLGSSTRTANESFHFVDHDEVPERGASPPPQMERRERANSPATALSLMFGMRFHAQAQADPGHRL